MRAANNSDKPEQGYRPKVEKGQDLEAFKKEELDQHGVKPADLVKTDYYWNETKKEPQAKEVVEDLHEEGINPGIPQMESVPTTISQTSTEMQSEPVSIVKSPSAVSAGRFSIPIVNKYISEIDIQFSPEDDYIRIVYKDSAKMPSWTNKKEYADTRLRFVLNLYKKYNNIIMDIPDMQSIVPGKKYTDKSAMGYNILDLLDKLRNVDRKSVFRDVYSYDFDDKYSDRITCPVCGLKDEIQLQSRMSDLNVNFFLTDITKYYKFCDNIANKFTGLANPRDVTINYNPKYDRFMFMPVNNMHYMIMDLSDSYRKAIYNHTRSVIVDHAKFSSYSDSDVFNQLLIGLGVIIGTFATINDLATTVVGHISVERIIDMVTTVMLSRWYKFEVSFSMRTFSLLNLMECIVLKLLFPARLFDRITRIRITNYIVLHLVTQLSSCNVNALNLEDFNSDVDVCDRYFTTSNFSSVELQKLRNSVLPFLRTGPRGEGFSGGGVASRYRQNVTADMADFHPSQSFIHESLFGRQLKDLDDTRNYYPQLQNFMAFKSYFSGSIGLKFSPSDKKGFINMIDAIGKKFVEIQEYAIQLDEFVRIMSFNSLTRQASDDDVETDITLTDKEWIEANKNVKLAGTGYCNKIIPSYNRMAVASGLAQLFGIVWRGMATFPATDDFLWAGFNVHSTLEQIVEVYQVVNQTQYMKNIWYKKRQRMEFAMDWVGGPFVTLLRQAMLTDTHLYIIPELRSTAGGIYLQKIAMIEKYIDNNSGLLGICHQPLFNCIKESTTIDDRYSYASFTTKISDALVVYDNDSLFSAGQDDSFFETVQLAQQKNLAIVFNIPVPLKVAEISRELCKQDVFEWDGMNGWRRNPLYIQTKWQDYQPLSQNKYGFIKLGRWSALSKGFIDINFFGLGQLMSKITAPRRLRLIDQVKWIPRI